MFSFYKRRYLNILILATKAVDMSEMKLTNPLVIHIASEVVVLLGLTLYFSSKNRALANHINGLQHRLEDQETQIGTLKQTVQQMSMAIGQLSQQLGQLNLQISSKASSPRVPEVKKETRETREKEIKRPVHKSAIKRPQETHTKRYERPEFPVVVPRRDPGPRSAPRPIVQVLEESGDENETPVQQAETIPQEPVPHEPVSQEPESIPSDIENADLDAELDEELEQLGLKKE